MGCLAAACFFVVIDPVLPHHVTAVF